MRPRLLLGMVVLCVCGCSTADTQLKPFATDGCSMMLDGIPGEPTQWRHCCVAHDKDYWLGGTEAERRESDVRIAQCITASAAPMLADWVHGNVRWGGSPFWPTPYRWGYGWPYFDGALPRGYKIPDAREQQQIDALLPAAEKLLQRELDIK